MPTEVRYIAFSRQELYKALNKLQRARGAPLPAGAVKRLDVGAEPGISVALTIETDDGRVKSLQFDRDQVGGALTLYCLESHIPLPRKSQRGLREIDGTLVLTVTSETEAVPLSSVKPIAFGLTARPKVPA